jgi:hypothetical protein
MPTQERLNNQLAQSERVQDNLLFFSIIGDEEDVLFWDEGRGDNGVRH